MNTFKEFQASQDPREDNKIMHSMLEAANGITFMASDAPNGMAYRPGTNMSMALSGDNAAELTAYFEKLSAGGTIHAVAVQERCMENGAGVRSVMTHITKVASSKQSKRCHHENQSLRY